MKAATRWDYPSKKLVREGMVAVALRYGHALRVSVGGFLYKRQALYFMANLRGLIK